jgi:hypothetical protein
MNNRPIVCRVAPLLECRFGEPIPTKGIARHDLSTLIFLLRHAILLDNRFNVI